MIPMIRMRSPNVERNKLIRLNNATCILKYKQSIINDKGSHKLDIAIRTSFLYHIQCFLCLIYL